MESLHNSSSDRILILDTIRGIALCGILIMNITSFALPESAFFNLNVNDETSFASISTWFITGFFLEGSFRGLFSMLFGASMILLVSRLEKNMGIGAADVYYRRLIWLLIFGLINAYVLLWWGDILYSYAVCGLFIFPLRNSSVKLLLGLCLFFIAITMFKSWLTEQEQLTMRKKGLAALSIQETKRDSLTETQKGDLEKWQTHLKDNSLEEIRKNVKKEIEKMTGSYTTVWLGMKDMNRRMQSSLFYDFLFFDIMIFILLGMAFFKLGILSGQKPLHYYWLLMIIGYSLGFATGFASAHALRAANYDWSTYLTLRYIPLSVYEIHRLLVTLGHLGLIMLLWKGKVLAWLLAWLANVGKLAFTNYLMQSVICTLVFYGYGLGCFAKYERYELWYFIGGIWVLQIIFSTVWLKYFNQGPLEWVWRSLTYWSLQPIKIKGMKQD
jgi:uncharacterized protein